MKTSLIVFAIALLAAGASARTWTSADGNKLEAEFISATETHVTIRREADGQRFTLELSKLSDADQDWVKAQSRPALGAEPDDSLEDLPDEVAEMISSRGSLLFQDDFNRDDTVDREDLGEHWKTNSESRAQGEKQNDLNGGALVMTLSDKADHAISTRHTTSEPFKDAVVSLRVKLEEDEQIKLAFNDREEESVWAGHVNGVTLALDKVILADEREGRFKLEYRDKAETPEGKEAMEEAVSKTEQTARIQLKPGEWIDVVTVHQGETLTVYLNGYKVTSFTSPGFGHETKRDFAFAVPKRATVDDLKIWKLAPGEE
ncbi:MAG: family 16 glycoside hydrolase [Verrucomicrobiales bacterium]